VLLSYIFHKYALRTNGIEPTDLVCYFLNVYIRSLFVRGSTVLIFFLIFTVPCKMPKSTRNIAFLTLREIEGQNVVEKGWPHLGNSPGASKRNRLCGNIEFILEGEETFRSIPGRTKFHGLSGATGRL
jgi:hypothetical protein